MSQSLREDFESQFAIDFIEGLSRVQMPTLFLGAKRDILRPVWQQKELAKCLREAGKSSVTFEEIDGIYGHETFPLDPTSVGGALKDHLEF